MDATLNSLMDAITYFSDPDNALKYLVSLRWPDGVTCPYCGFDRVSFLSTRRIWKCAGCKKQFSVKVGTIFEDSPLGLDKWLTAVWLISNCKNGISSYEIARDLKITQKSAWFMLHRIRLAMQDGDGLLAGEVEADQTFIGGKARNMHETRRRAKMAEPNQGKTIVAAVLERGGRVKARVVGLRRKEDLHPFVKDHVQPGANLFTDDLRSYDGLNAEYVHQTINHAQEYVKGRIHTNGVENFWSLLKRGIHGTYISVEPYHLFRYVDEQSFRYNERKTTDGDRSQHVCRKIVGRRLTWDKLTGKEDAETV